MAVSTDTLVVHKIISSLFFENTYLVVNAASGGAVLIDPGRSTWQRIKQIIGTTIKIEAVLITHAHFDHVFDLSFVKAETNAPVYLHQLDLPLYNDFLKSAREYEAYGNALPAVDIFYKDGDIINLGDIGMEVIHVPGHTAGSVCLKCDEGIFTGDTLMYKSLGDCAVGEPDEYYSVIKTKLFTLPENMIIYPGHSKYSTIGEEKRYNQIFI